MANPTVRVIYDPNKGFYQEKGDPVMTFVSGATVDFGSNAVYTPQNPGDWSAIPSDLIEAIDYLAAGSGSSGGGGGGSIGGTISNTQVAFGTAANTIGGSSALIFNGTKLSVSASGGEVIATDTSTSNRIRISTVGGESTLMADNSSNALVELHISASNMTMQSQVASGDFFAVDAFSQRLTIVDPGTGVDVAYLEGGRVTVDAAGNTISLDAFVVPTVTAFNVGSDSPMPLNLSMEALQVNGDPGSAGYTLVSSGSGYAPVWALAPYTAAVSADWNGTPPATIAEALDRIAAHVGPIP